MVLLKVDSLPEAFGDAAIKVKYGVHEQDEQEYSEIHLIMLFLTQVAPRVDLIFYSQASWSKRVEYRGGIWNGDWTALPHACMVDPFKYACRQCICLHPSQWAVSTCIAIEGRKVTYIGCWHQ